MLNSKEKVKTLSNGEEKVKKLVSKLVKDLSKEELIELVSMMAADDYSDNKSFKWSFGINDEINIVKGFIDTIKNGD